MTNTTDYKLNYLSKTFSKIDKKGIETYVISRIWNKLDNPDIKIVCQQYVKREDGYALLDLYLPQINFGVEVDEPHHLNKQEEDAMRQKEAEVAIGVTIRRVDCSTSIDDVHRQIDKVVAEINGVIANTSNFRPWLGEDTFAPDYYRKVGLLNVDDDVMLSTSDDICAVFGIAVPRRGYLRAGGADLTNNTFVWWPNAVHKIWKNELSADGLTIIEYHKNDACKREKHIAEHITNAKRRITFYRKRDNFGRNYYRFVGVFEIDKDASLKANMCVWRRVTTQYELE